MYQIHLFVHIFTHSRPMMDWIGVLESSHQALSISGSIESKYPSFTQLIQLGRGLESATRGQS